LRIFSLDRIRQAKTISESARATDPTELDRFLGASFGIFSGSARAWAVLRFSAEASPLGGRRKPAPGPGRPVDRRPL